MFFTILESWILWILTYIPFRFIILEKSYRHYALVPVPAPVPAPDPAPEVPKLFPYEQVALAELYKFDRNGEARVLETYLERLQRWIHLNHFRPLTCLKDNQTLSFFLRHTVKDISQKILLELFLVDRDTRLKALLYEVCVNANTAETRVVAKSIVVIISTCFGIPILNGKPDGEVEFGEIPMVLLSVLCSSANLFLCDFVLNYLTCPGTAKEMFSKYNLNVRSSIDTSMEDTYLANFLNKGFMQPVERKRPGFVKRLLFGREKNVHLAMFRFHAENILKDIRFLQTILTSLPDKTDNNYIINNNDDDNNDDNNNDDNNNGDNNNGDDNDDDEEDDEDDEEDDEKEMRKMRERLNVLKGMTDEDLDLTAPTQNIQREEGAIDVLNVVGGEQRRNRPRVERRLSWPLAKSGSKTLLKLTDNRGSAIVDERRVMQVLRQDYDDLVNTPENPISSAAIVALFHSNASIRDYADALVYGTPLRTPVRYRSNSVYDQIDFDKYGNPPSPAFSSPRARRKVPVPPSFVFNPDFIPSPGSDVSELFETRSMVSGENIPADKAGEDKAVVVAPADSSGDPDTDSLESMIEYLRIRREIAAQAAAIDTEAALADAVVKNWMADNMLAEAEAKEENDTPRAADDEEQERLEFLGIDYFDRVDFAHYFFDLPRVDLIRVLELREKVETIKQALRTLTSDAYVYLFEQQVLLSDMLPESVDILEELQTAYREMIAQYVNYQRSLEEYEIGYAILGMITFANSYIPMIRLLLNEFMLESKDPPNFEHIDAVMSQGGQVVANLKHTWETYVESSGTFTKVQRTYQGYIDNLEREFNDTTGKVHDLSRAYLKMFEVDAPQEG
ncbi:hypothetical protein HPULCUR_004714 [Helicostylum pulchrum]|uniref:Uncharacterized protein n=1 Tax=Helicostylum pulchrum TaxID=562976 RepID=A0ABP9XX28_9FUNG